MSASASRAPSPPPCRKRMRLAIGIGLQTRRHQDRRRWIAWVPSAHPNGSPFGECSISPPCLAACRRRTFRRLTGRQFPFFPFPLLDREPLAFLALSQLLHLSRVDQFLLRQDLSNSVFIHLPPAQTFLHFLFLALLLLLELLHFPGS